MNEKGRRSAAAWVHRCIDGRVLEAVRERGQQVGVRMQLFLEEFFPRQSHEKEWFSVTIFLVDLHLVLCFLSFFRNFVSLTISC